MFYIELERKNWDASKLQQAWQQLLTRHKQQLSANVLPESAYKIASLDCSADDAKTISKKQQLLRQQLLTGKSTELQTQGFAIKATIAPEQTVRLFVAFDEAIMDYSKFYFLWREWQALYTDTQLALAVTGQQPIADYWKTRLSSVPSSAEILQPDMVDNDKPVSIHYQHVQNKLHANDYRRLKVLAQKHQLSLTVLLLVSIQDIVAEQCQQTDFRLNLVLANRLPLFPYLGDKADYATSVATIPLSYSSAATFLQRAQAVSAILREDAKHLTTATLPMLQKTELDDESWLPIVVECNLQQGLHQPLLPEPADVVYYAGHDLRVNYYVSMWEQGGDLHYRCSMPQGVV